MLKKPIEITIYDDEGKPKETYKACIIPWKMMKKVTSMFSGSDAPSGESEILEEMTGFICELFHGHFTVDDLNEHASAEETMMAINEIMEELGMSSPNVAKELQTKATPKK
jgi:hypoxanthine phosphoribosyltransferase